MDYILQSVMISAQHLSRLTISVYGDAYIVGASIRQGVNGDIIVHYMSENYSSSVASKSITLLVVSTYNPVPEFEIKDFVPVDIVTKSDGKIYGIFAKFI